MNQSERKDEDARRMLGMQEEERRRIARELHDSLGQYLTAIKMGLDSLRSRTELSKDGGAGKELAECIHLATKSLDEVRTTSYLLYPPMLDEFGLPSAIPMYLDGFARRSGIQTTFETHQNFSRMPRDVELAFFRILQESLTNIHRHSGSPTAHVRIAQVDGMVKMEIKDEGKGISPRRLANLQKDGSAEMGIGLRGMKDRMQQLGGRLEITSNDGKGTMIRVTARLEKAVGA